MSKIAAIIGRLLLGILFVYAGAGKLMDMGQTTAYITSLGLPGNLALPITLFELIAGLCLAAGFAVRLVAVLLAVFTAGTILFAHNQFTDPNQATAAFKNLAIIGGLALAFAHSQMWSHYYTLRTKRQGEDAVRDAEQRAHEAELRAARAEASADAAHASAPTTAYIDADRDGVVGTRVGNRRWFDW